MAKLFDFSINFTRQVKCAILLLVFTNVLTAAELINITPEQLKNLQNKGAQIVDIRTPKEWSATGVIPGSKKLQFFNDEGKFNANKWLDDLNLNHLSSKQPIILVCHSGNRSKRVGNYLSNKLGMKSIYHLQNGIMSWIKTGNKILKD